VADALPAAGQHEFHDICAELCLRFPLRGMNTNILSSLGAQLKVLPPSQHTLDSADCRAI